MSKYGRNDVGSLVLDRATVVGGGGNNNNHHFLSFRSFRWRLIDTISCGGSSRYRQHHAAAENSPENSLSEIMAPVTEPSKKGEKLAELLKKSENEISVREIKRKEESLEVMKRVVRKLQNEEERERVEGAREVRKLAKEDTEARVTLSLLGSIPPLVGMLDLENVETKIASLYALLNLGIGNDLNKAAIVKAGAVHKMLKLVDSSNGSCNLSVAEAVVANFLGLSALDSNKPVIGSSGATPFLVKILQDLDSNLSTQAKQDSLRALYNLSISPSNIPFMLETDLIPFLMNTLGDMEMSERILSILSNLVATPEGRKAISDVTDAFPILIDVLNWTDSPGCQEKASYILMVMAHKAYGDRQAMIEAGIVSALLELTLLGSTLSQKRASRILECLRVDKGKQVSENYSGTNASAAVSAPICGSSSSVDPNQKECLEEGMMSEERKAVKQLVQQSLQNNMRRIVKRANLPPDFVPSEHFKSLTNSSTSKSLPF
ncbi:hypothetical protein RJ641_022117 [Dillenia turbinata]|uniref:U-box domain-containing protein n=1 Tax=Dillenia turbinata TaxID=194707 RepID=A0AAN8UIS8_9MAGN